LEGGGGGDGDEGFSVDDRGVVLDALTAVVGVRTADPHLALTSCSRFVARVGGYQRFDPVDADGAVDPAT
jgi:hypothetical protein